MGNQNRFILEGIVSVSRLLIYDTSNFIDFPIGGQLTSISNFLRFICEEHPERTGDIVLVGVTQKSSELGKVKKLELHGSQISFLPVAVAEGNLGNTAKSLRLQYAKGLLKYKKILKITKKDCNYIHTPEAYGVVKFFSIGLQCIIFSHGSYFNMERGFRFFQKNALVKKGFVAYLKWILKNADMIFLLDKDSLRDYAPYNGNLVEVVNSVVCPQIEAGLHELKAGRVKEILFVGRLSKDKGVESIIHAVAGKEGLPGMEGLHLTIVGNGEEYNRLIPYESESVNFTGAVSPKKVKEYMEQADILVMNSAFEGIPMTILEAISHALPVVSTNVGGIGQVLSFGQDSEETDATAESIQGAIRRISDNYESYSRNAYGNSKAFDYKVVNKKVYELLNVFWRR